MFRRKPKPAASVLDNIDFIAIGAAIAKLNKINFDHDVRVRGVLFRDDVVVGETFFHSPLDSYVVEWTTQ